MLHAFLLVLFTALASKLGFRDLTPAEETELPGYFMKAERIRRWVQGSVWALIVAILVAVMIARSLGW
jgi:hypothetical protein